MGILASKFAVPLKVHSTITQEMQKNYACIESRDKNGKL